MQSRERRAQTRQPHHRQHPHELEASEAYAKTPVGVGSLPWNPLASTSKLWYAFGSTARAARRWGQPKASSHAPPETPGLRPALTKSCQRATTSARSDGTGGQPRKRSR